MKKIFFLLIIFLFIITFFFKNITRSINAGVNNCKPTWKCPSPIPTFEPIATPTLEPTLTPIPTIEPSPTPDLSVLDQYYNFTQGASPSAIIRSFHDIRQSFKPSRSGVLVKIKIYNSCGFSGLKLTSFYLLDSVDNYLAGNKAYCFGSNWYTYYLNVPVEVDEIYYLKADAGNPIWYYNNIQPLYDRGSRWINGIEDLDNDFLFETYILP